MKRRFTSLVTSFAALSLLAGLLALVAVWYAAVGRQETDRKIGG